MRLYPVIKENILYRKINLGSELSVLKKRGNEKDEREKRKEKDLSKQYYKIKTVDIRLII